MPSNKPLFAEGQSPRDQGKRRAWQGGMLFATGVCISAATWFGYGFVWWGTMLMAVGGLFWMLAGLITMFTGYE